MARRRFSRGGGAVRRLTAWDVGIQTTGGGAAQMISSSSAVLFGTGATPTHDGITMIRIRGEFNMRLTSAGGASEGFHGAIGLAKAPSAAFLAGIASLPTPITEDAWDGWFYHQYINLFAMSAGITEDSSWQRITVDVKAMRKLPEDEVLYGAIELTEVGVAVMAFNF